MSSVGLHSEIIITVHDELTKYVSVGIKSDRIFSSLADTAKSKLWRIAHFINALLGGNFDWCSNKNVAKKLENNFSDLKKNTESQSPLSLANLNNAKTELERINSAVNKLIIANDNSLDLNFLQQLKAYKIEKPQAPHNLHLDLSPSSSISSSASSSSSSTSSEPVHPPKDSNLSSILNPASKLQLLEVISKYNKNSKNKPINECGELDSLLLRPVKSLQDFSSLKESLTKFIDSMRTDEGELEFELGQMDELIEQLEPPAL